MKPLCPYSIDQALAALAFGEGERGGGRRRKLSGVYILAAYDSQAGRPCRVFGASTSPHEVWVMDAEARRLIDHIDCSQEYGLARLSGYLLPDEEDAALDAAIERANAHLERGGESHGPGVVSRAGLELARQRRLADRAAVEKIGALGLTVEITRAGGWRLAIPELEGTAQERFAVYCTDALHAIRLALRFSDAEKAARSSRATWTARWTEKEAIRLTEAAAFWKGAALPVNPHGSLGDCRLHSLGRAVEPFQAIQATLRALRGLEAAPEAQEADLRATFGLVIVGPVFKTEVEAVHAWTHEDLAQAVRVVRGWRVELPAWIVTAKATGRTVLHGGRQHRPRSPAPIKAPKVMPPTPRADRWR